MKDDLFADLSESVNEGEAILRERVQSGQTFHIDASGVQNIRKKYCLSQDKFAFLLGISVATLRNWEQGRRMPEGPARVLLQVAATHLEVVLDVRGFAPKGRE